MAFLTETVNSDDSHWQSYYSSYWEDQLSYFNSVGVGSSGSTYYEEFTTYWYYVTNQDNNKPGSCGGTYWGYGFGIAGTDFQVEEGYAGNTDDCYHNTSGWTGLFNMNIVDGVRNETFGATSYYANSTTQSTIGESTTNSFLFPAITQYIPFISQYTFEMNVISTKETTSQSNAWTITYIRNITTSAATTSEGIGFKLIFNNQTTSTSAATQPGGSTYSVFFNTTWDNPNSETYSAYLARWNKDTVFFPLGGTYDVRGNWIESTGNEITWVVNQPEGEGVITDIATPYEEAFTLFASDVTEFTFSSATIVTFDNSDNGTLWSSYITTKVTIYDTSVFSYPSYSTDPQTINLPSANQSYIGKNITIDNSSLTSASYNSEVATVSAAGSFHTYLLRPFLSNYSSYSSTIAVYGNYSTIFSLTTYHENELLIYPGELNPRGMTTTTGPINGAIITTYTDLHVSNGAYDTAIVYTYAYVTNYGTASEGATYQVYQYWGDRAIITTGIGFYEHDIFDGFGNLYGPIMSAQYLPALSPFSGGTQHEGVYRNLTANFGPELDKLITSNRDITSWLNLNKIGRIYSIVIDENVSSSIVDADHTIKYKSYRSSNQPIALDALTFKASIFSRDYKTLSNNQTTTYSRQYTTDYFYINLLSEDVTDNLVSWWLNYTFRIGMDGIIGGNMGIDSLEAISSALNIIPMQISRTDNYANGVSASYSSLHQPSLSGYIPSDYLQVVSNGYFYDTITTQGWNFWWYRNKYRSNVSLLKSAYGANRKSVYY